MRACAAQQGLNTWKALLYLPEVFLRCLLWHQIQHINKKASIVHTQAFVTPFSQLWISRLIKKGAGTQINTVGDMAKESIKRIDRKEDTEKQGRNGERERGGGMLWETNQTSPGWERLIMQDQLWSEDCWHWGESCCTPIMADFM